MEGTAPKFVDVDGIRTRYFEAGAGEPILLVSGGQFGTPYCATDWDRNFPGLAKQFRVIAVDKIGQGHTDNPRRKSDYVIDSAVHHLLGFLDAVAIDSAHLVGHSRGGYAVTRMAMEAPAKVRSLTIVDSGTLMHEASPFYADVGRRAAVFDDLRERHAFIMKESSYRESIATDFWLDDLLGFVTTDKYLEAQRMSEELRPRIQGDLVARRREVHDWIRHGGLARIPVLLAWAYNDLGAPFEECGIPALRLFLGNVPDSRMYVFNRSGHFPYREHPAEFNRMLASFIQGITPSNTA